MILEILALGLGAGVPIALSQKRAHHPLSDARARDVAFYTAIGAGALSAVTRSSTLGAVALGSAGAWAAMKGDDVVRRLP